MLRILRCPRPRSAPRRRPARVMPRVEGLEDRRLLATFNPLPSAADGTPGSLRSAIMAADTNGQDNSIVLQAGTYPLTVANTNGQESGAAQGDLDLTPAGHTITIAGQGAGATIIDAGGLDRAFQIMPGVTVVLSGLTIQNGDAQDLGVPDPGLGFNPALRVARGGGILNSGNLELDGVVVQNCTAAGIPGFDGSSPSNPFAWGQRGFEAHGGGIYNDGTLTINQSIIRGNLAEAGGGGNGGTSADTRGSGGAGGFGAGGGIYDIGALTVSQSAIVDNNAFGGTGGAGGVDTAGMGPSGGSGGDAAGGGLYEDDATATMLIVDSTIAGNVARGGPGGAGGQAGLGGDPSTTPGSFGGVGGDGGNSKGGGIDSSMPFGLYNSTVAANQVIGSDAGPAGAGASGTTPGDPGRPGNTGPAFAGGIWAPSDSGTPGLVASVSSIIALNTDVPDRLAAEPDDVVASFSNMTSTLLQDGDGATGISNPGTGNLVGLDPRLGPLQDNGGPTPTMALLPGSPAIDAGSNPLNLTSDQRGYSPRVVGTATDMGAYELGASAPPGGGGSGASQGGKGGGGSQGGNGSGVATAPAPLEFSIVQHGWRRCIYVRHYPYSGWIRICLPLRWGHGQIQVTSADIGGVEDLVVRRPLAHHQFATKVYSGIDGSPLSSRLA